MKFKDFLLDLAERAAATFGQQFVVVLFAAGGGLMVSPNWLTAVEAGGIAALVSVLTTLASSGGPQLSGDADLALRVLKTFGQSFLSVLVVTDHTQVNWSAALATAIPVALLALAKGLVAMGVPGTKSGASLVRSPVLPDGTAVVTTVPATPAAPKQPGQSLADPGTSS